MLYLAAVAARAASLRATWVLGRFNHASRLVAPMSRSRLMSSTTSKSITVKWHSPDAARCSSQGRCLQSRGWSCPVDAAVWAAVIVIRKEPRQRVEPLAVGGVRPLVGPLSLHNLVERLRLAIGLRPEGSCALQPQVPCRRSSGEEAAHVAGAVIGQDALDREAPAFEVIERASQESSSAHAAFVGQDLSVGIARVVVYCYVDEVETEARPR